MTDELITQFSSASFSEWCREKFDRFTADPHAASDAGDFAHAEFVGYVQTLPHGETNRPLLVMAVHAGKEINERSSRRLQFDFARRQLQAAIDRPPAKVKGLFTQGLFAFYDDAGRFRLSLITGRAEGRRLIYADFKRQSFFVVPDPERNKTFRARTASSFATWESLVEAFSVETLTKEFYNNLFSWYERAVDPASKVSFPNDIQSDMDNLELVPEHMIRLITRLMFVWFIKQKGLVPEKIFRVEALGSLLKDFDPESETEGNYYNAILQNLFFATLNNKIEDRDFATNGSTRAENENHYGVKTLFRNPKGNTWFKVPDHQIIDLFEKVPFLNGGLFECLDRPEDEKTKRILYYDGFSREERIKGKQTRAHVPNCLFFNKDTGLIPLFARYDFTVDENSPTDADVALDPELLGKVFENLLGAYNPETNQTARNQSGSFYTPREIVSYMVDESLKQYLTTKVKIEAAALTPLFEADASVELPSVVRTDLVAAIRSVKILDPACGSGAFPMGALHRLVDLLVKLEGQAEHLYDLKLHLIENCIFGVDLQEIAVQICKLRFFISLVCEQKPNKDKTKNYGIRSLPNLETKFVCANTLIGLEKKLTGDLNLEDEDIATLRKELWDIRHQHFLSKSSQEKHTFRRQDKAVRERIQKRIIAIASTPDKEQIAHLEETIQKLKAEQTAYCGEKWEDILVPRQGDLFGDGSENAAKTKRVDTNRERREEIDRNIERCEREIAAERGKKVSRELVGTAGRLAAWDPYDQNASSPFFDAEWMFDVKNGFDIVIGNPPYVQIQKLPEKDKIIYGAAGYRTFSKTADLYCLFFERGGALLSGTGTLCYITSNKFFRSGYGKPLRQLLTGEYSIHRLIDFGELPVFEAGTDPVITQIGKESRSGFLAATIKNADDIQNVSRAVTVLARPMGPAELSQDGWSLSGQDAATILEKMRKNGLPLGQYVKGELYYGIKTGFNEAFILDSDTRNALIKADPKSREIIKPLAKGDDIRKWHVRNKGRWIILAKSGMDIKRYPAVFAHLKQWERELKARQDQGEHWWELRSCVYYNMFCRPKIVFPDIAKELRFALDSSETYVINTTYIIPSKDKFLLAVLNSAPMWFYARNTFASLGDPEQGGRLRFIAQSVNTIPIPNATAEQRAAFTVHVDDIIATKLRDPQADVSGIESQIDRLVSGLYALSDAEIAIVVGQEAVVKRSARGAKHAAAHATPTKSKKSVMKDDPDLA